MKTDGIMIKGFPVCQNGQDFIIGKAPIKDVLKYTRYTERVIIGYDENERPIYNQHVQRKVETARVNKIADFLINDAEATFPTNIVLGLPQNVIEEQIEHDGIINIVLSDVVLEQIKRAKDGEADADIYVTIIDGQHRIRGIEIAIERLEKDIENTDDEKLKQKLSDLLNIELVVSFFIDKSLEYQAMIFSTINRTQKKVSQDLVYSLFGLSTEDTPYKTALEVVLALNGHPKSPFYHRIKLYGGNYDKLMSPPLSQATMIKNIVSFISETLRESENDKYRKRKDLKKRNTNNNKPLPFREFYADDKDYLISDCLFYYFSAIRKILGKYWEYDGLAKPQNILQSTVGFEALMHLLSDILEQKPMNRFDIECFLPYIEKIKNITFADIETFPITTRGKAILYNTLHDKVFGRSKMP